MSDEIEAESVHLPGPSGLFGGTPLCGVRINGNLRQTEVLTDVTCVVCKGIAAIDGDVLSPEQVGRNLRSALWSCITDLGDDSGSVAVTEHAIDRLLEHERVRTLASLGEESANQERVARALFQYDYPRPGQMGAEHVRRWQDLDPMLRGRYMSAARAVAVTLLAELA